MKKRIISLSIMFLALFMTKPVYAVTGETSYMKGPNVYCGGWSSSIITPVTSPKYNYVRGDQTYTYFSTLGWLRSNVSVARDGRRIWIFMMEDDVAPNADETVKSYEGYFTQRQLTNIRINTTDNPGNIDSSGDPTVELFLSVNLDYVYGDISNGDNGEVFYYKFKVN